MFAATICILLIVRITANALGMESSEESNQRVGMIIGSMLAIVSSFVTKWADYTFKHRERNGLHTSPDQGRNQGKSGGNPSDVDAGRT